MLFVLALIAAVLWLPSPLGWILVGVAALVEIGQTFFWFWWSGKRRRAHVGPEALIGKDAVVVEPCRPAGQVRIAGELWGARCDGGADEGDRVRVRRLDGLTLVVERHG